jgi:transposase
VRHDSIWVRLLGLKKTVVEEVDYDEGTDVIVVHVRPKSRARSRCGVCCVKSPGYDRGQRRRRWRASDAGLTRVYVEADVSRVSCHEHGVVVAMVPWARHGAGHTLTFDDEVAWLATNTSKSAVCELKRIAWRTVGSIVARVWADTEHATDPFADLRRIGIDEISYRKGHKYLTIVVDHDSGRLVWAAPGRDGNTLRKFFESLGSERSAVITHVSSDAASWIVNIVKQCCPQAIRCADPFHIVVWANEALTLTRRRVWNGLRSKEPASKAPGRGYRQRAPEPTAANAKSRALKKCRWVLGKNPENLTGNQQAALDWIALHHPELFRAYQLKESLRLVFRMSHDDAVTELDKWIAWARRCRIPAFVELQKSIVDQRTAILASIEHGLSNGRIESTNTKIRRIIRIGFGFHSPEPIIALAMLSLSGNPPQLPGRNNPRISQ